MLPPVGLRATPVALATLRRPTAALNLLETPFPSGLATLALRGRLPYGAPALAVLVAARPFISAPSRALGVLKPLGRGLCPCPRYARGRSLSRRNYRGDRHTMYAEGSGLRPHPPSLRRAARLHFGGAPRGRNPRRPFKLPRTLGAPRAAPSQPARSRVLGRPPGPVARGTRSPGAPTPPARPPAPYGRPLADARATGRAVRGLRPHLFSSATRGAPVTGSRAPGRGAAPGGAPLVATLGLRPWGAAHPMA